ncbi:MAG: hypothetical protein RSA12_00830, partial [Clostridia bacterium]
RKFSSPSRTFFDQRFPKVCFTENGDVIIVVFCISIFHSHDDYEYVGCGDHDGYRPTATTSTMAAGAWLQRN